MGLLGLVGCFDFLILFPAELFHQFILFHQSTRPINPGSDVEPEVHHISILYHIFFSFNTQFTGIATSSF